jgi:hypothetical protein
MKRICYGHLTDLVKIMMLKFVFNCLGQGWRTYGTRAQSGIRDFIGTRHSQLSHFFRDQPCYVMKYSIDSPVYIYIYIYIWRRRDCIWFDYYQMMLQVNRYIFFVQTGSRYKLLVA